MVAKKRSAAPRKRLRKAVPPPDDPLLRHEEMEVDRLVEGMPELMRQASRALGRGKARAAESPMMMLARMRLTAMESSRAMPGPEEAAARAVRRGPAGRLSRVAPVQGVSNWVQLGPVATPKGQTSSTARVLVTGRVTAIVVDPTAPETIYLGTAQGGVWKTTDGGRNWHPKSDHEVSLAIGALAMDPGDPRTLYAGTGEGNFSQDSYYGNGLLKTRDGGDTWVHLAPATFMGKRFTRLAVTPGTPDRLFAATTAGLYRSADGGESWAPLAGLPAGAATDVAVDPAAPATVYVAIWGQGIFKTANASAGAPRWTRLSALPESGFSRISLALAPSSPRRLYALVAGPAASLYPIDRFLASADGGATWAAIPLPGGSIGKQGFYNLVVAVDPMTPDIVYLGGVSLWKATRSTATGAWTVREVGRGIHPDQHAVAVDPHDNLVVYAGCDGGIYRSADGGETWSDTINEGPCLTQFEFIDQHPTSAAVVFGGTQDNGTAQYRNSPVFLHADDGDGGHCLIDRSDPRVVLSTYYGPTPKRSTKAGELGTWMDVSPGLEGQALFYPPLAMDETDPRNVALGTDRINLDAAQGTGRWPVKVALPGITGKVSALHYVHSGLLYAATTQGEVYRLARDAGGSGGTWTAEPIHDGLPARWIWEVAARADDPDTVLVALSGFGTPHVWSGKVPPGGGRAAWTDVSANLPDVPVNALAIDPAAPDTWYIATDVAVYRTEDGGGSWVQFSQGLPNCAVFDLRLHAPTRLLRAATHGRGLWERQLDVAASPPVDLYFRDHLMATGRGPSEGGVTAAFADPLQHAALGDRLWWWESADLKVDALEGAPPAYQMPTASVDYAAFESRLQHRRPQRGRVHRVYVQVHNRGFAPGTNVVVKLLWANAAAGLPPLPADFWTAFPGDSGDATHWHPVGAAQVLPSLSATEPAVLAWDWSTPPTASEHVCLLAVMDCPADPIPQAAKALDLGTLVPNERRVTLKSLHLVDAPVPAGVWTSIELHAPAGTAPALRLLPSGTSGWTVALLLPTGALPSTAIPEGFAARRPAASLLRDLERRLGTAELRKYDTARLYTLSTGALRARLPDLRVPRGGLRLLLGLTPPSAGAAQGARLTLVQERGDQVAGGCTFVLRARR